MCAYVQTTHVQISSREPACAQITSWLSVDSGKDED